MDTIEDIREIRTCVIEAVARTVENGFFFDDGTTEEEASKINDALKKMTFDEFLTWFASQHRGIELNPFVSNTQRENHRSINQIIFDEILRQDRVAFDRGKMYELLFRLAKEGLDIKLQKTEDYEEGKFEQFYIPLLQNDIEFQVLVVTSPLREVGEISDRIANKIRDRIILQNILKAGSKENILYVGTNHKLEGIDSTQIDDYRVEISIDVGTVMVTGTLPEKFAEMMKKYVPEKTKSGKDVRTDIMYV